MAMWLPVVAVCVWSLGSYVTPIDCSHFMGGIIHWRPVDPAAFDGRVRSGENIISYVAIVLAPQCTIKFDS